MVIIQKHVNVRCYYNAMNSKQPDIYKAAAIIIRDGKLLVTRSKGKSIFIAPGGKLEPGETPQQALIRELREEQTIEVSERELTEVGVYDAVAAGQDDVMLRMYVYKVNSFAGALTPSAEIEENRWITSTWAEEEDIEVGSIFAHEVIPKLKAQGLID